LGLIWHVTPDEDGKGGYGTKVEILGQWMGSMDEYESVMDDFNEVLEKHGVGEMQKEKRPLSESFMYVWVGHVPDVQRTYNQ
jgi:hypothetical protein